MTGKTGREHVNPAQINPETGYGRRFGRKAPAIPDIYFRPLSEEYDRDLARLIRRLLEKHHLDIPGTAYYDDSLDHLSSYYLARPESRVYDVLLGRDGRLLGGIGLAEFPALEGCCELQKLYLSEQEQGRGLGYHMIDHIEDRAVSLGYKKIYLETHTNLEVAIHTYEQAGYRHMEKPAAAVHSTMNRFFIKELK